MLRLHQFPSPALKLRDGFAVMPIAVAHGEWSCIHPSCSRRGQRCGRILQRGQTMTSVLSRHWRLNHRKSLKANNVDVYFSSLDQVVSINGKWLINFLDSSRVQTFEEYTRRHWNWSEILQKSRGGVQEGQWIQLFKTTVCENLELVELMEFATQYFVERFTAYGRDPEFSMKLALQLASVTTPAIRNVCVNFVASLLRSHLLKLKYRKRMSNEFREFCFDFILSGKPALELIYLSAIQKLMDERAMPVNAIWNYFSGDIERATMLPNREVNSLGWNLERRLK